MIHSKAQPKSLYSCLVRPLLFSGDPEAVHERVLALGGSSLLGAVLRGGLKFLVGATESPELTVSLAGLRFPNPVGLAAGFDKNAQAISLFASMGFGSLELGTVTPAPQEGNPRPRIFRFPRDRALINRMGFPSEGAEVVAARVRSVRARGVPLPILGLNIGKLKTTPVEAAAQDYLRCFKTLRGLADYFVLNVSSPNTPELRKLQEPERLKALFAAMHSENSESAPIFVKIAPDLATSELEGLLEVCLEAGVSGIIATNTTITRDGLSAETSEAGGLSGEPLKAKSLAVVERVFRRTEGKLPIIGVGGISSPRDALAMLGAGASLIQIYTGLVYSGPLMVPRVLGGLLIALKNAQLPHIGELVGIGATEAAALLEGGRSEKVRAIPSDRDQPGSVSA